METRKPAWWQLYLFIPVMFGLIGLEVARPLPAVSSEAVVVVIVLLFFATVLVWVHLNGGLLERYADDEDGSVDDLAVTVVEPASRNGAWTSYQNPMPMLTPRLRISSRGPLTLEEKGSDKWSLN